MHSGPRHRQIIAGTANPDLISAFRHARCSGDVTEQSSDRYIKLRNLNKLAWRTVCETPVKQIYNFKVSTTNTMMTDFKLPLSNRRKSRILLISQMLLAAFALALGSTANAQGDAAAGKAKAAVCAACHGTDGKALQAEYPNLAGQGAPYLMKQLQDYKSGARDNAIMMPMAAALSDEDMADIAAFYSTLPAIQGVAVEENLQRGRDIYRGGISSAGIAACIGCHGPNGAGNPAAGYPALSGQNASYTYTTLQQFRAGTRANDANRMMRDIAHRITNEEIAAVANYLQGLK